MGVVGYKDTAAYFSSLPYSFLSFFGCLPGLLALKTKKTKKKEEEMGNCQAIDAATLVVQHPCGKVDKFYWPVSASEIMKMNPGHYVALLISTTLYHSSNKDKCPANSTNNNVNPVRLTRIKLLRATDTLVLGQVYRLITTQGIYIYFLVAFCSLF